jgi:hypothetical protein
VVRKIFIWYFGFLDLEIDKEACVWVGKIDFEIE